MGFAIKSMNHNDPVYLRCCNNIHVTVSFIIIELYLQLSYCTIRNINCNLSYFRMFRYFWPILVLALMYSASV